jgi:general secretion pathway protein A
MYNSYFGFAAAPFAATPDPVFFYKNSVYQEGYANLQYGVKAKKGFIVITGEVGTGKTTLLRRLMTENVEGTIRTVFVFNTYLSFTELLELIVYDLGLTPKGSNKVKLLQELNEYLIEELKRGNIVAVLVDEAQNLTDEALEGLRLLSNLETDQEKLIQVVLMGQPELQEKLDRPNLRQLKQRVALQCRLLPLADKEVPRYVDFRLHTAGHRGPDLFSSDALRQITFYSHGIPRLVNIMCDNALLCAFGRSLKKVSSEIVDEVAVDLRLGSELKEKQPIATAEITAAARTENEHATESISKHKARRMLRVGVETFAAIVILLAIASLIDPHNFVGTAKAGAIFAKHNLNQWYVFMMTQPPVQQKAVAADHVEATEQRITIPRGSTISKIAAQTYGANAALGMDLIKEFNPEITNLRRVPAGYALALPSFTPQTLLRKQSDGSYQMIVASFHALSGADEYAARLRTKGYQVTITPRRISDDLVVHRVKILGLKNLEEARQTWRAGLKNEWLVFASNTDPIELSR